MMPLAVASDEQSDAPSKGGPSDRPNWQPGAARRQQDGSAAWTHFGRTGVGQAHRLLGRPARRGGADGHGVALCGEHERPGADRGRPAAVPVRLGRGRRVLRAVGLPDHWHPARRQGPAPVLPQLLCTARSQDLSALLRGDPRRVRAAGLPGRRSRLGRDARPVCAGKACFGRRPTWRTSPSRWTGRCRRASLRIIGRWRSRSISILPGRCWFGRVPGARWAWLRASPSPGPVLARAAAYATAADPAWVMGLTPMRLDGLALGALASLAVRSGWPVARRTRAAGRAFLGAGGVLGLVIVLRHSVSQFDPVLWVFGYTLVAAASAALIWSRACRAAPRRRWTWPCYAGSASTASACMSGIRSSP